MTKSLISEKLLSPLLESAIDDSEGESKPEVAGSVAVGSAVDFEFMVVAIAESDATRLR